MVTLLVLVAGIVTAAKSQWLWLLVGLATTGLLWLYSAFKPAKPGSLWARTIARRA